MTAELPKHISFSQLTTMLTCGEQYRLDRLEGLPSRPGWATVGGTAVHEATQIIDENPDVEFDYKVLFNECFDRAISHDLSRYQDSPYGLEDWKASGRASKQWPDKENEAWWRHHGPMFVGNWVNWRNQTPLTIAAFDDKPAIELELDMELAGTPLKVVIDRLMTGPYGLVVVDIKSGAFAPKSSRQLAVYAEALRQATGVQPQWGQYFDARKGTTSIGYPLAGWTKARLDYEFGGVRKIQEQGIFIASPNNMCGSCGVRDYCLTMGGSRAHEVPQPWES